MAIPLEYRGTETLDDVKAFNARASIPWKGDLLFRVYPTPERVFFIKIGGAKNQNALRHFGLIGMIAAHYDNKREAKRTEQRLAEAAGLKPVLLMQKDKANHILQMSEISEPVINPPSFWSSTKFASWSFKNAKGKKRIFKFEDLDNFRAGVRWLTDVFGEKLIVKAEIDDTRGKVRKIQK